MRIKEIPYSAKDDKAQVQFIYNRFDLHFPYVNNSLVVVEDGGNKYSVSVAYYQHKAKLGLWLIEVPEKVLRSIIDFIFKYHEDILRIIYDNSYIGLGRAYAKNHFKIELPKTEQELHARLSSKGRYNIKREKRIIFESFENVQYEHYMASDAKVTEVMEAYFRMKAVTHHAQYNLSSQEYIDKYHVTDLYAIRVADKIVAVVLSCEQCDAVYIENITYDLNYSKYSLGQILYDEYLIHLIEKEKRYLYLGGGDLDYKKRYGSIEEIVYTGEIERNWKVQELTWRIQGKINQWRFLLKKEKKKDGD